MCQVILASSLLMRNTILIRSSGTSLWLGSQLMRLRLIVWLQGGVSSSFEGIFVEIGPFEYVNKELKLREWSWTKEYSVLFIDNPPGIGYSYTNDSKGYVTSMEMCVNLLYNTLTQFYQLFPELDKAPLYIAGESNAGAFIPVLGMKIFEENKAMGSKSINLQGLIMGNPPVRTKINIDYSSLYYQWGLIDPQGKLAVKQMHDEYSQAVLRNDSANIDYLRTDLLVRLQNIAMISDYIRVDFINLLKKEQIKEAIHVGHLRFRDLNPKVYLNIMNDMLSDTNPQVTAFLDHYRILIYCGQFDITAACVPNAEVRRNKWFWSQRNNFMKAPRTPWWYDQSVAGYVKQGGGFTEVLVTKAGHRVAMNNPEVTLQLITHFINGISFPMPPFYDPSPDDTPAYIINENYSNSQQQSNTQLENNCHGVMLASVVINVLLVFLIVAGVVYVVWWKRRTVAKYKNVDNDNSVRDGVVPML